VHREQNSASEALAAPQALHSTSTGDLLLLVRRTPALFMAGPGSIDNLWVFTSRDQLENDQSMTLVKHAHAEAMADENLSNSARFRHKI
jgi:hypothetical protein